MMDLDRRIPRIPLRQPGMSDTALASTVFELNEEIISSKRKPFPFVDNVFIEMKVASIPPSRSIYHIESLFSGSQDKGDAVNIGGRPS